MKVKDLKIILESFDENLEIADVEFGTPEIRDFIYMRKGEVAEVHTGVYLTNRKSCTYPRLTDEIYKIKSEQFLFDFTHGYTFTSIHGDYRLYKNYGGRNDSCYGTSYDPRIIKRMIKEGLLFEREAYWGGIKSVCVAKDAYFQ